MRKQINPNLWPYFWAVLWFIVVVVALAMCSGCKLTRDVSKQSSDSTHVKTENDGGISKQTSKTNENSDWWKETVVYQPGRDTTINNNYFSTTPAPAVIIREGGKQSRNSETLNLDSLWRQRYDSLQRAEQSRVTETKVQVLSFWQIVAIAAVVGLVLILLSKLKIGFK